MLLPTAESTTVTCCCESESGSYFTLVDKQGAIWYKYHVIGYQDITYDVAPLRFALVNPVFITGHIGHATWNGHGLAFS